MKLLLRSGYDSKDLSSGYRAKIKNELLEVEFDTWLGLMHIYNCKEMEERPFAQIPIPVMKVVFETWSLIGMNKVEEPISNAKVNMTETDDIEL